MILKRVYHNLDTHTHLHGCISSNTIFDNIVDHRPLVATISPWTNTDKEKSSKLEYKHLNTM